MRFDFCPYCGNKAVLKNIGDEGSIPFCESCNILLFDMFSACVLCVPINELKEAALIKQGYVSEKYVGVAGYIKPGETAEQAAAREVSEEIGITPHNVRYVKSSWYEKKGLLMLWFIADVHKDEFRLSCEVDHAEWFTLDKAKEAVRIGSDIYKLICSAEDMC